MIYLVTSRASSYDWQDLDQEQIIPGDFDEFVHWAAHQAIVNFDTETTMTEFKFNPNQHEDRKLLVIQFGSIDKLDQWIFDLIGLDEKWIQVIKRFLGNEKVQFIIHNATFDYTVVKAQLGVSIENMQDTCLMSNILNTGIDTAEDYHSLVGCLDRFFNIQISKEEQTGFTVEPLSKSRIIYAATDVVMLYDLFLKLKELLEHWDLWYLYDSVERQVLKAYCDMSLAPMRFDSKNWSAVSKIFEIERDKLEIDLIAEVRKDAGLVSYLLNSAQFIKDVLIQPVNEVKINWGSVTHKNLVLQKFVPSLPDTIRTKPELKAWFKLNLATLTTDEVSIINLYLARSYDVLTALVLNKEQPWLESVGLYIPKDTILINWASNIHKLFIFQYYYPKLVDTNAKSLARITTNPLINVYKKFSKANKSVTTYGESFIEKYVDRHGTIAPSGLRQILSTGRIAFGILLQLPANKTVRNSFLPPEDDWLFVDSDFQSAEVAIMAWAAGETAFLDAIKRGTDLHMMSAKLIYSAEWQSIAESGCINLVDGRKCECVLHNKRRKNSKAITFGLAFGLSYIGLADRLDITRAESQDLMTRFFAAFPKLKGYFETSRDSGIRDLYIKGLAPTSRVRFFEHPQDDQDKAAIGRESMNYPIQEACASIVKIALINLRKLIIENKYPVRLHLPVHDEILSSAHKDFAEQWKIIQDREMRKAADLFLEPGLLGTDTTILEKWTK